MVLKGKCLVCSELFEHTMREDEIEVYTNSINDFKDSMEKGVYNINIICLSCVSKINEKE